MQTWLRGAVIAIATNATAMLITRAHTSCDEDG